MATSKLFRNPRYRKERLLGKGGMGHVFLARDLLEDGRRVALKLYPRTYPPDILRREFTTLREVQHPGVARAHHFGTNRADGAAFFTMEYVRGHPLHTYLKRERRRRPTQALSTAVELLGQVASSLAYLHRRGILHLDVKPANVLVVETSDSDRPAAVLIDFGLVRLPDSPRTPVLGGTAPYVAPEFFRGVVPDASYDVYAVGVTFYSVLAGRLPFEAHNVEGYRRAHLHTRPPPLPEIPDPLESVILRALAKDPRLRFPDGEDLARAVRALDIPGVDRVKTRPRFHPPDFVGRHAELDAFRRWLERGVVDSRALVFEGSTGCGKSRLLEKIETELELGEHEAVRVDCERLRENVPGETLRRLHVLYGRPRGRSLDTQLLVASSGERALDARSRAAAGRWTPAELRERVLTLQARRAAEIVHSRGVFLLLDNLHAGGRTAVQFVERLAVEIAEIVRREGQPHRALPGIVGTILPASGGEMATALETLEAHWEKRQIEPLGLREATRIEIDGLAETLEGLPARAVRATKSRLYRQSGGNPLFFLHGLLALGTTPSGAQSLDIPRKIKRELSRLDEVRRRLLAALVLLERPASSAEVAPVVDRPVPRSAALLRDLEGRGLVTRSGHGFRPSHETVREVALSTIGEEERAAIHGALAEEIQASGGPLSEAAHHWFRSGRVRRATAAAQALLDGLPVEPWRWDRFTVPVLLQAADAAPMTEARALLFLEHASDVLEADGRYGECIEVRSRIASRLGVDLARERRRSRRSPRSDSPPPARALSSPVEVVRALRKLAATLHLAGRVEDAEEHLRQCREILRRHPAPQEEIAALAEEASICHFRQRGDEALRLARAALERWRALSPGRRAKLPPSLLNLYSIIGQVHIRRLEGGEAVRWLRDGVRLAARTDLSANLSVLLNNLGLAFHLTDRFREALDTFRRAEAAARDTRDAGALVSILCNVAQIHAKTGRFRQAQEAMARLDEIPAVSQSPRLRIFRAYTAALTHSLFGTPRTDEWREVRSLAEEAGDRFLELYASLYEAESLIDGGRLAEARERLEPRRASSVLQGARLARLAYVASLGGDPRRARQLRQRVGKSLDPASRRAADWSGLYLAASAAEDGELDEARAVALKSEEAFRRSGARSGLLESSLQLADIALRRGELREARKWTRAARHLRLEDLGGAPPRRRDVRLALLEARARLVATKSRHRSRIEETITSIDDLVARAAGDPQLARSPGLALELAVVRASRAVAGGDFEAARIARIQAGLLERRHGLRAAPATRSAARRVDRWRALGLAHLGPPRGRVSLRPRDAGVLDEMLRVLDEERNATAGVESGLRCLGRGGGVVELCLRPGEGGTSTPVTYRPREAKPDGRTTRQLTFPVRSLGTQSGTLLVTILESDPLEGGLVALMRAGARILALLSPAESSVASVEPPLAPSERRPSPASPASDATETRLLERTRLLHRSRSSASASPRLSSFVAESRDLQRVLRMVERLRDSELPVLITGESGTGKDHVAAIIHETSRRSAGPFLVQNCSALAPELLEADLIGYKRGAFSGADSSRTGFLFQAQEGTFHLEEIADIDPQVQARLLRWIEEGAARPLGASSTRRLDVRFIASTQRDVEAMVRRGEFRRDLLFRLNGIRIHLPPLRQRPDDVAALVRLYAQQLPEGPIELTSEATEVLLGHTWPGNVRELISVLRRLAVASEGGPIRAEEARRAVGPARSAQLLPDALFASHPYEELQRALEEGYLRHLMERHGGDLDSIARELGTTTRSVYRRFERLGWKPGELDASGDGGRERP